MLLKFKARVDIFNLKGESPLHISCHNICSIEVRVRGGVGLSILQ